MTRLKIALVVLILALGFILKLHNYSIYPQRGASSDEYTYTFLGISLWEKHIPISWSAFPNYKHKYNLTINKLYFPMVYPYFDHPPLNGLLVGGWAILFGENSFTKVTLSTIRLVPIILSMISAILVFLLGLRLYDYKTGIFALLIYTTVTIFVMNTRVVFAENLLTPLFLGILYLFIMFKKTLNFFKSITLGVLCGLAFLTKELGISAFLSTFFLFTTEKIRPKLILIFSLVSLLVASLYVAYGFYYDKDLFLQIASLQSARNIGPQTLTYILSTPIIVNKVIYDGWYFLGFVSIFLSLFNYKENKMIIVPAFFYLFLLIFSLTRYGEMGWYIIPLYPFMALSIANLFVKSVKNQGWYIFVMLLLVGLSEIKFLYEDNFGLVPFQFRTLLIIMFAPFILSLIFKKEKWFAKLSYIWFYLLILGNIIVTYNYIHPA